MPYNPYNGNYYGDGSDAKKTSSGQTVANNKTGSTKNTYGNTVGSSSSKSSSSNSSSSSRSSSGSSSSGSSSGSSFDWSSIPSKPSQDWVDSLDQAERNAYSNSGGHVTGGSSDNGQYYTPEQRQQQQQQLQIQQLMQQLQMQPQFNYQDLLKQLPSIPQPKVLNQAEAKQRAEGQLNPLYDEMVPKALQAVDQDSIRRGFFGQMPAAEKRASTATDLQTRKAQAIGQLSNQLIGQSEANANSQQQLALQQRQAEMSNILGAMNQAQSQQQNKFGNLVQLLSMMKDDQRYANEDQWRRKLYDDEDSGRRVYID